jgi:hypothetical protein
MRHRLRKVLVRTDLWSDQMIVLRAVQTLTMLDLQHNCELVWNLGGYERFEPNAEGAPSSATGNGASSDQADPVIATSDTGSLTG